MFLKRFLLLCILVGSYSCFSGKIPVSVRYSAESVKGQNSEIHLIEWLSIGPKGSEAVFEKSDSLFREWKVTGNGYDGSATLFVSKERGIGWVFKCGDDSLKALIARDYRNTNDPRILSITTSFVSGLFIVENFEPDCNSYFRMYALKNSWDADVEYTGPIALEIESSDPCGDGSWHTKTGKLKVPEKIMRVAIFTAVMTHNIRYLFKDFTL